MGCVNTKSKNTDSPQLRGKKSVFDKIDDEHGRGVRTARIIRNSKISEKYSIEEEVLGTGISGAVRAAINKTTGRKVAVKTLLTSNISTKKFQLLYNELDIYLRLDHPNICKLLEVFEDDQAVHLIMELCTGKELYERLATKRRYSEKDAARITKTMLEAMHYCHNHRICHRDLKLENWVYADPSPDSPLKLIDFGFSKIYNPGIPMTAMHGTVYYVAPEVMEGNYNHSCDVWSIGVIVFMLLSGAPPFSGQQDHEIIAKIKRAHVAFPGPRWTGISEQAKEFIRHLLRRDPADRPSAIEATKHPWIAENCGEGGGESDMCSSDGEKVSAEIDPEVIKSIRTFSRQSAMKRAALGLMAFTMSSAEVEALEKEFRKVDTKGDGIITMEALSAALVQHKLPEKEREKIFKSLDQTGDQEIHYSEFLAATLQAKLVLQEQQFREAFQRFDVDNSGFISLENLKEVLGDEYNGMPMEEILKQVDRKQNGTIDYDDFVQVLMDNSLMEASDDESPAGFGGAFSPHMAYVRKNSTTSNSSSRLLRSFSRELIQSQAQKLRPSPSLHDRFNFDIGEK